MDQIKTGQFIAKKRKAQGLTQARLAEMLGITDRAVSKWERGISMPDSSIMLELCEILNITVNELLTGEDIEMKDYDKAAEKNLLELKKQNEDYAKSMLRYETFIGILSTVVFLVSIMTASLVDMKIGIRIALIAFGSIIFVIGIANALRIEQTAGYYECAECHHKYVPSYKNVFFAMHLGRTRYMKCPECKKYSWNKKVTK
ncbi:MAG: helix-turn-helix domain-containing protein [Eubacterium sp.]